MSAPTRFDLAWQALSGRDDLWGGCANREQVERIEEALAEAERRGADRALSHVRADLRTKALLDGMPTWEIASLYTPEWCTEWDNKIARADAIPGGAA